MRPASAIHPDDLPRIGRSDAGMTVKGFGLIGKIKRDQEVNHFFYDLGECGIAEAKAKLTEALTLAERMGVQWHEGPYLVYKHVTHSHWYAIETRYAGAAAEAPIGSGDRVPLNKRAENQGKDVDIRP